MEYTRDQLQSNYIRILDLIICLPFLAIPLLVDLPYRVNIFLSWEGAYRLLIGQIPYEDFGLPLGFGYWLIPALSFKLFGPELITLVKAQILINFMSLLSIRGMLYRLKVKPLLISMMLLIFCLTYVIYNFWPWYNHSVIVFELVGFYFLIHYITGKQGKYSLVWVIAGAFFIFLSFFTKQDAGGMAFVLSLMLLGYDGFNKRKFLPLLTFTISFITIGLIVILPFIQDGFFYWFNYGQSPHNSRVGIIPLIDVVFSGKALWEKLYLAIILTLILTKEKSKIFQFFNEPRIVVLFILTIGMLGQAIVTRVSSPLPTDHMTYFHVFAIILIIHLSQKLHSAMANYKGLAIATLAVTLIFSGGYWRYVKGVLGMNVSKEDNQIPRRQEPWKKAQLLGFKGVLLPTETLQGINNLLQTEIAHRDNLKVLNMSELTPLALSLNYEPPTNQPLWYHLNVGIFQKEINMLSERVKAEQYDLVLFQDIPGLNNFFPYQVRDILKIHYRLQDRFLAPRKKEDSYIEVYVKKRN